MPPKRRGAADAEPLTVQRRRSDVDFTRKPINQQIKCSDPDCIPAARVTATTLTVKIIRTKHNKTNEYTNSYAFLFNEPRMPDAELQALLSDLQDVMEGEAITKCACLPASACMLADHVLSACAGLSRA